jgi:hypothetical protein
MALSTGARPGPDKILSLVRQGEIGEVYPTRDTELGREHRRNRSCLVAKGLAIRPRVHRKRRHHEADDREPG